MVETARWLTVGLRNAGIGLMVQDSELKIVWTDNLPAIWGGVDLQGLRDEEFLPVDDAARLTRIKQAVLDGAERKRHELRYPTEDGSRWMEVWIDPDLDGEGRIVGIVSTVIDRTEQRHREQALRTLLREVSHRSKNLLAIIQSIATQTGRYSGSIEIFLNRFRGRIQSLAFSQDLVTSSDWRGATLGELVSGQVARYFDDPAFSIRFTGEDPYLNPNAALHIGLALHELVINSMSHGALSRSDGHVLISADLEQNPAGHDVIRIVWCEDTGVDASSIGDKKFGSVALERVVPASLEGTALLSFSNGQLKYVLDVPDGNFELARRAT